MPEIQYHPIRDPRNGMIQALTPLPAAWVVDEVGDGEVGDGKVSMRGPGGIRVHPTETHKFAWSADPFRRETAARMGYQLAPVASLEQILEQNIRPSAAAQGSQLVRTLPVPRVEELLSRVERGMAATGSRRQFRALGSEWTDLRGKKSFVLLVQFVADQGPSTFWGLQTTRLEAPAEVFADAKADYLYAMANTRINPQWQAVANGRMVTNIKSHQQLADEMMRQSRRAHQQRMAAIEARGNTARSVGRTYSDILDISHQGYLQRDDISTAGHEHLIDTIRERTVIGNHETGEHYEVPSGAEHYWVRDDAYYLGTDDVNFDPNRDPRMNQFEWTRFVVER